MEQTDGCKLEENFQFSGIPEDQMNDKKLIKIISLKKNTRPDGVLDRAEKEAVDSKPLAVDGFQEEMLPVMSDLIWETSFWVETWTGSHSSFVSGFL